MSEQLTEEDRKVSIDRLVSALKSHGDSNMSEKEVVDLAVKAEEGVYAKHPTNKKEYFSIIAGKLMRITQRTATQKQPPAPSMSIPPVTNPNATASQSLMGMNMPQTGMYTNPATMGMPIQRTNISVSGTANNPIAISTSTIPNNPLTMNMPSSYAAVAAPKQVPVPQPVEDTDWEKYTEKHNHLATRYVTILEQMMKQFEKSADVNPSFETFKNRIQNFYRILKEPNFRPGKTPEESVKALEVMEKNIEGWVQSITQRKGGIHPAHPPSQPPSIHPQPPQAHPQPQPQPNHPPLSTVSPPPVVPAPVTLPSQPTVVAPVPQPAPQPPIQPEKSALPLQASPPMTAPPAVPVQPIAVTPSITRVSDESTEGSVEEFFTTGIITGFLDKLSKSAQDLKEMKTVLERITKTPATDETSGAIQADESGLHSKSLRPPSSTHHKRFWWSRDSQPDLNKVKQEKLKSSDGLSAFGSKRFKRNDDPYGTDTDFSGMHSIFPSIAKAVRVLMKNPEGRSFKRVFKSVDENKLFVELVMDEHKPEAAASAYLMQLELHPDEKQINEVFVGVTVKRTMVDKLVFIPALVELQALSYSNEADEDKWIGFLTCYKRYLEKYHTLFSQIEELQSCGYDISSRINHDATALLSCRFDSMVLVPVLQVMVYLDSKTHKAPEIHYSEDHDLFLQDVKAKLESKIRSLSRVVQQPTLPLVLSSWKSIVELQYL